MIVRLIWIVIYSFYEALCTWLALHCVLLWLVRDQFYPYSSGLCYWHCVNRVDKYMTRVTVADNAIITNTVDGYLMRYTVIFLGVDNGSEVSTIFVVHRHSQIFTLDTDFTGWLSYLSTYHKILKVCLNCPASRTTLVATRFRVAVICPIIQVPHCIRVFFYFVWFVFINHIFQFYYELCTYCNILDIYLS